MMENATREESPDFVGRDEARFREQIAFFPPKFPDPTTRMNPERVFALMFQAASQTVLLLSQDKKRLGGTPAL